MSMFKNPVAKSRTVNNFLLIALIAAALGLYKYSVPLMRLLFHRQEIADMGAEVLQPIIVSMIYVLCGVVFSTITALFMESQLKENAYGGLSRFGIVWMACFFGFCQVAAALL